MNRFTNHFRKRRYSVFFLFFSITSFSQNYRFKTFTTTEGLSSYNSNRILQDQFGFIWITTQEGMNRFDGRNFMVIKKRPGSTQSLNATYVTDCKPDRKGMLWTSSQYGGVDVIDPRNLRIIKRINENTYKQKGFISNWVRTLSWSPANKLWIGTYYGINIYDDVTDSLTSITVNPFDNTTPFNVSFIGSDPLENMVICAENQGVIIMGKNGTLIKMIPKHELGFNNDDYFTLNNVFTTDRNTMFLCTSSGLFTYDTKNNTTSPGKLVSTELVKKEIRCIEKDEYNNYWVGTDMGVYVINVMTGKTTHITHDPDAANSLLNDYVNNIFRDSYNNMWISTTKGINILLKSEYDFEVINRDRKNGVVLDHTYTITSLSDSLILVSDKSGFFRVNFKTNSIQKIISNFEYGIVDAVYCYKPGQAIFSGLKKLGHIQVIGNTVHTIPASSVFPELKSIENHSFSSIFPAGDSIILFGSMDESGLFVWNQKTKEIKNYTTANGLADNYIQNIRKDTKGNIWLLSDLGLTRFDIRTNIFSYIRPAPGEAGKINSYFLLDLLDDGNNFWVATYGGGINYSATGNLNFKSITEETGLNSNSTYCIIKENDSLFWTSSNNGLTRINRHTLEMKSYYYGDGLQSSSFEIRSSCKTGNSIFFGGVNGITRITRNPNVTTVSNSVFPVYISGMEYYSDGNKSESNDILPGKIKFRTNPDLIVLSISALSFLNVNRLTYEYQIEESADKWLPVSNKKSITLSNLSPGSYHITVRCKDDSGIWNYTKPVNIIIFPKWYQTWWFKTSIALLIIAIGYLLYRIRINQLKKEQRIRTRLASDLHDDLGSTMNSVKVYTSLAMMEHQPDKYLPLIKGGTQDAINGIRDIIWVLDDTKDSIEDLLARINSFASPLCEANAIKYRQDIADDTRDYKLGQEERRNLYMMMKEAVNNAIKYAGCKNIDINIASSQGKLRIEIRDDGKGFDTAITSEGNGLRNMQRRAKEIRYAAVVNSSVGEGTSITLTKI